MSLLALAGTNSATGGYEIENSLKFEADNTEYLSRNPSTDTNRQTFTYSTWVKRTELGQNARLIDVYSNGQNFTTFGFDTSDRIVLYSINGGVDYGGHYTQRFRDTSAWYHIIWKSDTTNATAANRWQIYVNGVEVTGKDIDYGTPPQNFNSLINTTLSTKIGYNTDGSNGSSQYMAETHLVDGTALEPTEFGEFDEDTGIWKPKAYTGSYGTNGFYLEYKLPNALGADTVIGGNSNDFTANNITAADQATDSPTNNFCTFNAISVVGTSTYTEGGTVAQANKQNDQGEGTIMFSSGNWYFEMQVPSSSASSDAMFGFAIPNEWGPSNPGDDSGKGFSAHNVGRWYYNNNGHTSTDSSTAFAKGDIVSLAINTSSEKAWVAINGTWATGTNPATGTGGFSYGTLLTSWESGSYLVPAFRTHYVSGSKSNANFGGFTAISISTPATDENGYGTFEYAPPTGFYALCTKNLEEYG